VGRPGPVIGLVRGSPPFRLAVPFSAAPELAGWPGGNLTTAPLPTGYVEFDITGCVSNTRLC
jgi:hypothetical protein